MLDSIVNNRLACAQRYFELFAQTDELDLNWIELIQMIDSRSDFGIPEALVLIHPKWYDRLNFADPRGKDSFTVAPIGARCRSLELWGYECPFVLTDRRVHVDHTFPRARGGVTHRDNAMYLCAEHNLSKSTDIHFIPWESISLNNSWLKTLLKNMMGAAERISSESIYFPEKQLSKI